MRTFAATVVLSCSGFNNETLLFQRNRSQTEYCFKICLFTFLMDLSVAHCVQWETSVFGVFVTERQFTTGHGMACLCAHR